MATSEEKLELLFEAIEIGIECVRMGVGEISNVRIGPYTTNIIVEGEMFNVEIKKVIPPQ